MSPQVLQNIYTLPIPSLQQELGAYLLGTSWDSGLGVYADTTDSRSRNIIAVGFNDEMANISIFTCCSLLPSRLYAIAICQVVLYFRAYRLDPRFLKSMVCFA